jgi:hypothetical protein
MPQSAPIQLANLLDQSNTRAVLTYIRHLFVMSYDHPTGLKPVEKTFRLIAKLFAGRFPGYHACNTEYHDFNHTLDCLVAVMRLIDGHNSTESAGIPERSAIVLLQAALCHDTGYIQAADDIRGTGAKYTKSHVERSTAFVAEHAASLGLTRSDAALAGKLIRCTGLSVDWHELGMDDALERLAGSILGTADLIGQMADRRYLEKLLFLYYEFREAGIPGYETEFDILRLTLGFYETARERLDSLFSGTWRFAAGFFARRHGIGENLYMTAIEHQMEYLRAIIADPSSNFRKKLKRMDLERVGSHEG